MTRRGQRFAAGFDRRRDAAFGDAWRGRIEDIRERVARGEYDAFDPEFPKIRALLAEYATLTVKEQELGGLRAELIERTQHLRSACNLSRAVGRLRPDDARVSGLLARVRECAQAVHLDVIPMSEIKIYPHGDGRLAGVFKNVGVVGAPIDGQGRMNPRVLHVGNDETVHLVGLAHGMQSGLPSVALAFELPPPDGRLAFVELSLRSFLDAADQLKAAHGDPRLYPGEMVSGLTLDNGQTVTLNDVARNDVLSLFAERLTDTPGTAFRELYVDRDTLNHGNSVVTTPRRALTALRAFLAHPKTTLLQRRAVLKHVEELLAMGPDAVVEFAGLPKNIQSQFDQLVDRLVREGFE